MDFEVESLTGGVNCIRLNGRMDSAGVDRMEIKFNAALVAAGRNAVIDLSNVSFLASMGIRMLITGARSLKAKGAKVVLFGANSLVKGVLENVALGQIVPIVDSESQALEQLAS